LVVKAMARRAARFTEADLARAIKAALNAGLRVVSARIERDGAMLLVFASGEAVRNGAEPNPWDA
jgi:hypothetical protein